MSIDITSRWKQKEKYQCSKSTLYLNVCYIHLFAWRHTNLYSEPVWGQFRVNMFNRPISNESTKSLGIKGEYTLRAAVRLINANLSWWWLNGQRSIVAIMFNPFGFIAPKTLSYMTFQSFDFELTWWRFFQKGVVRTKCDFYVFITCC